MHKFFVLILGLFCSVAYGQIEEVRRITEKLCSPEFHGRGYVQHGDSIAAAFLVEEFTKLEIEPYLDSYYQYFGLDVNTFPGKMNLSQKDKQFIPGLHFSINPSSIGGQYSLHTTEITTEQVLDLDFLRGLISEIRRNPSSEVLVFNCLDAKGDTLTQVQGIINEIATLMPVIELVNKKFTWSVGREQSYFPFIQLQDSVYAKGIDFELNVDAKLIKDYRTQNVIAYVPARKKCNKTLMFTAHYDHLGRMGAETYFPGANDNASGTAMLLTMAKYFKENPSEYNILFVAFAGEEAGLVGSKFFVENPILKLKKIKFLVNLDIMGSGEEGITVVNGTLFKEQFDLIQTINKEKNLLEKIKIRGPAANSDHYWFSEKGVPAIFIYTMGPNKHYHDVFDAYEELSFSEYDDITTLLIEFVKRL